MRICSRGRAAVGIWGPTTAKSATYFEALSGGTAKRRTISLGTMSLSGEAQRTDEAFPVSRYQNETADFVRLRRFHIVHQQHCGRAALEST